MSDFNWVKTQNALPAIGEPLLVKARGVIQHITYRLDGCCNDHYWFDPYHFDAKEDLTIDISLVSEWAYFPS